MARHCDPLCEELIVLPGGRAYSMPRPLAFYLVTTLSSRWAKISHIPTNEKRRQVIEHWRAHIPPGMSNEKAGEWLHDSFPELSVRKLSEYVARAKKEVKEIPPAGKA